MSFTFNIAKGTIIQKVRDGSDFIVVLLKAAEADDTLKDYTTLAALLGAAGNTEADFTNYTRTVINNASLTESVNNTTNQVTADITVDISFTPGGGAVDNDVVFLLVCEDGASDAARVPLTGHTMSFTADGSNINLVFDSAGFFRASDA